MQMQYEQDWYNLETQEKLTDTMLYQIGHLYFKYVPDGMYTQNITFHRKTYDYQDDYPRQLELPVPYLIPLSHRVNTLSKGIETDYNNYIYFTDFVDELVDTVWYNPKINKTVKLRYDDDIVYLFLYHNNDKIVDYTDRMQEAKLDKVNEKKDAIRDKVRNESRNNVLSFLNENMVKDEFFDSISGEVEHLDTTIKTLRTLDRLKDFDDEYHAPNLQKILEEHYLSTINEANIQKMIDERFAYLKK